MQQVFVGDKVKVVKLERHAAEDRSAFVDKTGQVVQKLNVPWTPEIGNLWRIRFLSGGEGVFSENEIAVFDPQGMAEQPDMDALKASWGDAPRTVTLPFKRRFGAGTASAPVLLAVLIFAIAGALLIWAGVAQSETWLGVAGGLLILIGLGAAAVLVT
jgi:hypothetical protein